MKLDTLATKLYIVPNFIIIFGPKANYIKKKQASLKQIISKKTSKPKANYIKKTSKPKAKQVKKSKNSKLNLIISLSGSFFSFF